MIKVIAFDYDGVIKIREGDVFEDVCNFLGIDRKDWEREYFLVNHFINTNKKTVAEVISGVVSKFTSDSEKNNHVLGMIKNYIPTYHLNYEMIDLVKELRNMGYKTALITNNSSVLRKQLEGNNILSIMDEIIISAEVGYQKPEPEIFNNLFEKINVNPADVVFIDDTMRNLEKAEEIGYMPVLYTDNTSLKIELSNILGVGIK